MQIKNASIEQTIGAFYIKTYNLGTVGNVIAGGAGGQFAKSFAESADKLGQGIVDTALNAYLGIGGTVATEKTAK